MTSDVYFNCPSCSHTILTEMDQVGRKVECADCGEEVTVPLIRDGLNPRMREKDHPRRGGLPSVDSVAGVVKRAELVQKGMVSLERRQERQNLKVAHLIRNMELMVRQLDLLENEVSEKAHSTEPLPAETGTAGQTSLPQPEPLPPAVESFDRVPNVLYAVSIVSGLLVAVWWLIKL